jgi:hypothetical protein
MLRTSSLLLATLALTACPSAKPKQEAAKSKPAPAAEKAAEATEAAKDEAAPAATGAAAATGAVSSSEASGSAPAAAVTGPDTEAAKLNPAACTKPTEGKPVAYRLAAFGAGGSANVGLRLDVQSKVMTGEGFRLDAGGLVPETINHAIDAAKIEPFTTKLDALCLNFAIVTPDTVAEPSGFTRYGVEFADGSIRWMSDTNPGLSAGEVFGKVERDKWLDLNSSWPKYQDAKPL